MDKNKLVYTEDHEWVEVIDDKTIRLGITDYAVDQLGDIVYVELPELEDEFEVGEAFSNVESVKSTSEIYTPVAGVVTKINESLEDEPENMNEDPYELGWICEITSKESFDVSNLMSYEAYLSFTEE
ncbi:glycine cleavage system protein GcvH [Aerococcaceae bacterium WGS1372]